MAKKTEIYTVFTDASGITRLLYSAPTWIRVRLTLQTAGPVSVGTREDLGNVLSGQGVLLTTDEEIHWDLDREDRLFWVAESINRVRFSVERIAYGESYDQSLKEIARAEHNIQRAVVAATPPRMREAVVPAGPDGKPKPIVAPRLTRPRIGR
jgi:hypothetical protein